MAQDPAHAARREPQPTEGPVDLHELGRQLLAEAADLSPGRLSRTLTPGAGGPLKQTLLAITGGQELDEHESPGAATLFVVDGAATIVAGDEELAVTAGEWTRVPPRRHSVRADQDAVILLTVAP